VKRTKGQKGRNANTEIDVLPVISILAVCISFLLLTAVWIQVGSFDLSQALGTKSSKDSSKESTSLWVQFTNEGKIRFEMKTGTRVISRRVSSQNQSEVELVAASFKNQNPDLTMAVVLPTGSSNYQNIIMVMDSLRKNQINDIGIAPL
jgi:biopolymer transport protein TolR